MSDIDRLRNRDDDDQVDRSQETDLTGCDSPTLLVRTKTVTTYPTTAGSFYACSAVLLTGAETEGGAGTLTLDSSPTIYAYNIGSSIPASGTNLVITYVRDRWVFRYD